MGINPKILDVIACPLCKGKLQYDKNAQTLICRFDRLVFPIENGVPVMLAEKAVPLIQDEHKRR